MPSISAVGSQKVINGTAGEQNILNKGVDDPQQDLGVVALNTQVAGGWDITMSDWSLHT